MITMKTMIAITINSSFMIVLMMILAISAMVDMMILVYMLGDGALWA